MIGNGWVSPVHHYESYLPFAYDVDLLKKDSDAAKSLERTLSVCQDRLREAGVDGVKVYEDVCEGILQGILGSTVQTCVVIEFCVAFQSGDI
jgi:carboxypeptidase D